MISCIKDKFVILTGRMMSCSYVVWVAGLTLLFPFILLAALLKCTGDFLIFYLPFYRPRNYREERAELKRISTAEKLRAKAWWKR